MHITNKINLFAKIGIACILRYYQLKFWKTSGQSIFTARPHSFPKLFRANKPLGAVPPLVYVSGKIKRHCERCVCNNSLYTNSDTRSILAYCWNYFFDCSVPSFRCWCLSLSTATLCDVTVYCHRFTSCVLRSSTYDILV